MLPNFFGRGEGQGSDSDQGRGDKEGDQAGSQNPSVGTKTYARPGNREIAWPRCRRLHVLNVRRSSLTAAKNAVGSEIRQGQTLRGMFHSGSGAQIETDFVDESRRDATELGYFG